MRIQYTPPEFIPPEKPALTGQLSQAWDYLVNRKGLSTTTEFDEDFEPIGPQLREQLGDLGVVYNTSGDTTIMFFG